MHTILLRGGAGVWHAFPGCLSQHLSCQKHPLYPERLPGHIGQKIMYLLKKLPCKVIIYETSLFFQCCPHIKDLPHRQTALRFLPDTAGMGLTGPTALRRSSSRGRTLEKQSPRTFTSGAPKTCNCGSVHNCTKFMLDARSARKKKKH